VSAGFAVNSSVALSVARNPLAWQTILSSCVLVPEQSTVDTVASVAVVESAVVVASVLASGEDAASPPQAEPSANSSSGKCFMRHW
jgi:hypothetical protein